MSTSQHDSVTSSSKKGLFAERALPTPDTSEARLQRMSATEALRHMVQGDFSCEHYVQALVARTEAVADTNAFIDFSATQVLEAARALDQARPKNGTLPPLWGLPIPIKDSVFTQDFPTTAGTSVMKLRQSDADLVTRLRRAGGLVMGKTNLHELSSGFTSNNPHHGPVRNPYAPDRVAGGSSGGTAAAVALGCAPLGVAEDTAGSVRVPAALCGIVGFRPTIGRYPTTGVVPLAPSFDQVGPHARCVADIQLFDRVVTGRPGQSSASLQGIRLGVPRGYLYDNIEASAMQVFNKALEALRDYGVELVEHDVSGLGDLLLASYGPILFTEIGVSLDVFFKEQGMGGLQAVIDKAGPETVGLYSTLVLEGAPAKPSAKVYQEAAALHRPALRQALAHYFWQYQLDAIVYPTVRCGAPEIGADETVNINGVSTSIFDALGHNTILAPAAELPSLTLPIGFDTDRLPVAMGLDALPGDDERLLALGAALEPVVCAYR